MNYKLNFNCMILVSSSVHIFKTFSSKLRAQISVVLLATPNRPPQRSSQS
eukprot:UN04508